MRNVPVTVAGDRAVVGFNRAELTELFKLSGGKESPVAGPALFATLDRMLQAVIRAARQVPPDRLTWTTPDRNRPLKVFCYHILADPNHVLEAISTGIYDGTFKLTYEAVSARFHTMEELARFGEETRARLRAASKRLTAAEMARPIKGYAGPTDGHELLHLVLSHTTHHLRQFYDLLQRIGIQPDEPLGEKDFEGISLPRQLW